MKTFTIREIEPSEHAALGALLESVYAGLEGFPSPGEQPGYYEMLRGIGAFQDREHSSVLVAVDEAGMVLGGLVYFDDMAWYGSGGSATGEKNAAGFRWLGVSPGARGLGVGKALSLAAVDCARKQGVAQVIIHTTQAMSTAWEMYLKLGFRRSPDLDFDQQGLAVFGFRLCF